VVQADASEVGLEEGLSAINGGEEHPILYLSEVFAKREELCHSKERVPSNKMGPGILPDGKEVHSSNRSFSFAMDG